MIVGCGCIEVLGTNGIMFNVNDSREFWVRAEDRNKHAAKLYDELGLAEYEAIEAFKRFDY